MEIARRRVVNGVTSNSSNKVPLEQIIELPLISVPITDAKFAGYSGCSVRALLGAAQSGTGIFVAGDGMTSEPIAFDSLSASILMHMDANGHPLKQGGPLRAWIPPEAGLRCSSGNPISIKDVRSLTLTITPT